MRLNLLLLKAIALSMASSVALAYSYRTEVNVKLGLSDFDHIDLTKSESKEFSATYYFNDVAQGDHPLAEAAFMGKSSNFTLAYYRNDQSAKFSMPNLEGGFSVWDHTVSQRLSSVDIEFYIPNSIFYIGADIKDQRYEFRLFDPNQNIWRGAGVLETDWSARLGLTPAAGMLVWTELIKDQDFDKEWNINAKYVFDLGGNTVNLEGSYIYADETDIASVAADYYLDQSFSVGLIYEHYQGEYIDATHGVRSRKFFTKNLSLEAAYIKTDYSDDYSLGITYRF